MARRWRSKRLGLGMAPALACGVASGARRRAGLRLVLRAPLRRAISPMLTLAFAQIVWSIAFQWTDVTGGDNGIIGVWPAPGRPRPQRFYLADCLASARVAASRCCARSCSRRSATRCALCATSTRAPRRSASTGGACNGLGFALAGAFAGARRGALRLSQGQRVSRHARHSVVDRRARHGAGRRRRHDRRAASSARSCSAVLSIWMISHTDYSRLVLGALIILLVVLFPGARRRVRNLAKRAGARSPPWRKPMSILVVEELGKSYSRLPGGPERELRARSGRDAGAHRPERRRQDAPAST